MDNQETVDIAVGDVTLQVPATKVIEAVLEKLRRKPLLHTYALPDIGSQYEGGIYVGLARGFGERDYPIILLPGTFEGNHADCVKWAEDQGGTLPNNREGALLFANAHDQFEARWYWLLAQYAGSDACAWCQTFGYGSQLSGLKGDKFAARAVRRV